MRSRTFTFYNTGIKHEQPNEQLFPNGRPLTVSVTQNQLKIYMKSNIWRKQHKNQYQDIQQQKPPPKYRIGTISTEYKITGGLKLVLQAPYLAINFYSG